MLITVNIILSTLLYVKILQDYPHLYFRCYINEKCASPNQRRNTLFVHILYQISDANTLQ